MDQTGMRGRNPRVDKFIEEYLKDLESNGTSAAIAAGYRPKRAASTAWRLLKTPYVQEAIKQAREASRTRVGDTLDSMVEELNEYIQEARKARQFTAVANLVTTKAKIRGFLIDKHHIQVDMIDISGAMAEAKARATEATPKPDIIVQSCSCNQKAGCASEPKPGDAALALPEKSEPTPS